MGEDVEEEGVKEEQAKEAPAKPEPKKRKAVTNDIQQMVSTLINDNTSNLTDFAHTHLFDIHTAEE